MGDRCAARVHFARRILCGCDDGMRKTEFTREEYEALNISLDLRFQAPIVPGFSFTGRKDRKCQRSK
jgi:hypothetical protein